MNELQTKRLLIRPFSMNDAEMAHQVLDLDMQWFDQCDEARGNAHSSSPRKACTCVDANNDRASCISHCGRALSPDTHGECPLAR